MMKDTKQQWFKEAKFGLFIHWGLYALLAGEYKGQRTEHIAEWIMNYLDIPPAEYEKLAEKFNPVNFDADAIVSRAKNWGMKYIVFTAKHHEGFAMYDSKCSNYNVVKAAPYGKDVLRQLQKACEKYDMKLGLYYSQAQDWHDPNGLMQHHDDSKKDYQFYLDHKVKPQLTELLTEYGDIALIWFDTPMSTTYEQSKSLVDLVKSLQPNCIVSGRIGNNLGDYITTADNFIPRLPYDGDWEVPATLNDTWGFNRFDQNWKSADEILQLLLKINGRGGNYLLNIGPDGLGNVPEESIRILDEVGGYVKRNQEALFGTKRLDYYTYEMDWAEFTQKDYKLYLHVLKKKNIIEILNVANQVKKAYIVENATELEYKCMTACEGNSIIEVRLPKEFQEKRNYCICLELEEKDPIFEPIER
ncbi:alpha-L-fucosidase [Robinsoniella sp. KNHs210]|uniref:alpha-L-fucosidase n=1 Tax=Robinsoniella sp. KNHs210 TaxID=1469950 RepID=UPI000AB86CC8|nr:alpha-L-fucosidase [Robinsoniella sp. KNHs210]